jgi:hypothetical protein
MLLGAAGAVGIELFFKGRAQGGAVKKVEEEEEQQQQVGGGPVYTPYQFREATTVRVH